jgi:radical SAM superfamily enzyme YgiQ (UPF0313 family)
MKVDLIAFNCRYTHSCLALFYVRGELEKQTSIQSEILQFTINDPYYNTLLQITNTEAEVLFFSVYIWNADYIKRLLRDIHKAVPEFLFVLGGPQAPSLAKTLSQPTTVVTGEIEGIDTSFYTDLVSKKLKPLYSSKQAASFAFPYKSADFDTQLKNRNIYYESSRGCPFSCSYCLSSISRGIQSKNLSSVKKELAILVKHKPPSIRFVDRTFNADPQRALAIWMFLLKNSPKTTCYHFEIAADIFTEEMFTFLESIPVGFFQFEIGIQSTNKTVLSAVNRKMSIEKSFNTIKRLLAFDTIHLHVDLILGLPFDSQQSFYQSLREIFSVHPHYTQMGLLKVLPGTGIEANAGLYEIEYCSQPPYQVLSTKWLKHKEIRHLYLLGECLESFYNNRFFKTFFRYIASEYEDCIPFWEGLLEICNDNNFFSLAKTQALMNELLFICVRSEPKKTLLEELLLYDWLSCGHRFLPKGVNEDLTATRNTLYKNLPETIPDLYDQRGRNFFFKKNVFYKFSGELLRFTGLSKKMKDGYVVFLSEEKSGVIKKNVSLLITLFD